MKRTYSLSDIFSNGSSLRLKGNATFQSMAADTLGVDFKKTSETDAEYFGPSDSKIDKYFSENGKLPRLTDVGLLTVESFIDDINRSMLCQKPKTSYNEYEKFMYLLTYKKMYLVTDLALYLGFFLNIEKSYLWAILGFIAFLIGSYGLFDNFYFSIRMSHNLTKNWLCYHRYMLAANYLIPHRQGLLSCVIANVNGTPHVDIQLSDGGPSAGSFKMSNYPIQKRHYRFENLGYRLWTSNFNFPTVEEGLVKSSVNLDCHHYEFLLYRFEYSYMSRSYAEKIFTTVFYDLYGHKPVIAYSKLVNKEKIIPASTWNRMQNHYVRILSDLKIGAPRLHTSKRFDKSYEEFKLIFTNTWKKVDEDNNIVIQPKYQKQPVTRYRHEFQETVTYQEAPLKEPYILYETLEKSGEEAVKKILSEEGLSNKKIKSKIKELRKSIIYYDSKYPFWRENKSATLEIRESKMVKIGYEVMKYKSIPADAISTMEGRKIEITEEFAPIPQNRKIQALDFKGSYYFEETQEQIDERRSRLKKVINALKATSKKRRNYSNIRRAKRYSEYEERKEALHKARQISDGCLTQAFQPHLELKSTVVQATLWGAAYDELKAKCVLTRHSWNNCEVINSRKYTKSVGRKLYDRIFRKCLSV